MNEFFYNLPNQVTAFISLSPIFFVYMMQAVTYLVAMFFARSHHHWLWSCYLASACIHVMAAAVYSGNIH